MSELIEKIQIYLPIIDVQQYDSDDNPYVTQECALDDDDIQEIIDLVEQSQWIKVSDRLPENESILCMIYARDYYEFGWWHEGTGYWDSPDLGYIEKDEVTWWQPIPSPPE